MRRLDVFGYSFNAIKLRKLRAGLTTLGVVIGIAAIVALLSITSGLEASLTSQLNEGLSADTLVVTAGSGGLAGFMSNSGSQSRGSGFGGAAASSDDSGFALYVNDTEIISSLSTDIELTAGVISRTGYVQSDDLNSSVTLYAVDFGVYEQIYSSTFITQDGSIPTNPDKDEVIVGERVVDPDDNGTSYFGAGDKINITWTNSTTYPPKNETMTVTVSGVLAEIGGLSLSGPSDSGVYIPIESAQDFFGSTKCSMIVVKLSDSTEATIDAVTEAIKDYYGSDVSVMSSTSMLSMMTSIFSTIQLFLVGIAGISLLVAGIGIMNIMIVSMIERTREIGILKALGMKSRTVLSIFLGESAIIGVMGAVIGIAAGFGLAVVVANILGSGMLGSSGGFTITPVLSPMVLLGAFGFGVGVSVIFALYPAWKASKLKPVVALRYE
ncbi:MAG: ABC transporter permease [Candidatus Bathyarchaeota archaeon]|nr:ABC transporter permease [Candidatus Bathyarchaeota archaeon]